MHHIVMKYNTDDKMQSNTFQIWMKLCTCYLVITNANDLWTCAKRLQLYSFNREQNGVPQLKAFTGRSNKQWKAAPNGTHVLNNYNVK